MQVVAKLTKVIYEAAKNGWCICQFEPTKDGIKTLGENNRIRYARRLKTVGIIQQILLSATYKLTGDFVIGKHGEQFDLTEARLSVDTKDAKVFWNYLSDIMNYVELKALSSIPQEQMIEAFQDGRAIEALGNEKAVQDIVHSWNNIESAAEVLDKLSRFGIPNNYIQRIVDFWGPRTMKILEENPYQLIEIRGMGFPLVDQISIQSGIAPSDIRRKQAGITHILNQEANYGHVWTDLYVVLDKTKNMLRTSVKESDFGNNIVIVQEDAIAKAYLRELYDAEIFIAMRLKSIVERANSENRIPTLPPLEVLDILNDEQKKSVVAAAICPVSILTGGPGTGKTFTIGKIVDSFQHMNVVLLSPTGKAAKRMEELTGSPAQTIHAFIMKQLKIRNRMREEPKEGHLMAAPGIVVIDEFSFVDTKLFADLLELLPTTTKLVLVGDRDQLPSISAGSVLADLIDSEKIPTTNLTQLVRTKDDNKIAINCKRIRTGDSSLHVGNEFRWADEANPLQMQATIKGIMDANPESQVLIPQKSGPIGLHIVNEDLQAHLNPNGEKVRGTRFRVGDKIIILTNDYDIGVRNGEIGKIVKYTKRGSSVKDDELKVEIDGTGVLTLPGTYTENMALGYAISIHKSQGSEYQTVVVVLHNSQFRMLTQKLLYTAISRAKKTVFLVADSRSVSKAIATKDTNRRTTLWELMGKFMEEQKSA